MSASVSHPAPRTAVFAKVDTLGDLVLFAPTLQAIRSAWPDTRIVVLIRRNYAELAEIMVDGVEWLTTSLDPFVRGPADDPAEVSRLRAAVGEFAPEVFVAATARANWLETVLAASSGAARRLGFGDHTYDEFFATQLRLSFSIDPASAFNEHVARAAGEPDWQQNLRLADAAAGRSFDRTRPSFALPSTDRQAVQGFLSERQLPRGKFIVCAAAGFANVAIKTWPAERFGAVLRHARGKHGLPALLIGHESERAHLEKVAAAAGDGTQLWLGRAGTLRQLAAIIAEAALFLGNDTGAMHLAAALDVPVVAIFGGGTWPRFVPAARRGLAVVQPLPCFGCGWDCAFGDAPCIGGITTEDVIAALDRLIADPAAASGITAVEHLSETTRAIMGKAANRYHEARADHLARQHKLEELTALDREKDAAITEKEKEIDDLKVVCNEREKTIFILDGHVRNFQAQVATLAADKTLLEKAVRDLPPDAATIAQAFAEQSVHVRNVEALVTLRDREIAELKASAANRAAGLHELEQAKHYSKLLAEKEAVIRNLQRSCEEREAVIRHLSAEATTATAKARKLWLALRGFAQEKVYRPLDTWLFNRVVEQYWMQIGVLRHYAPKPLKWDERLPASRVAETGWPKIGIVTPSYGQERFIERTMRSVLDQHYPKLLYVVQDGGSKDRSAEIIARHAARLHHWESVRDNGQADAIARGFRHITGALGDDDVMAWLNSDDLLAPGVLRFVADYFARHPHVDVIYGHRIIIDDDDRDVGRWIMPRHNPGTLEWIDYVPQETLFWRKRAWNLAGGIDPSFQFALDWDLLARFQQAGCRVVRVPYFLGAFRVHAEQKTSQAIHTTGAEEMRRIRTRFHGDNHDDFRTIERHARHARFWGAITARLHEIGVRW